MTQPFAGRVALVTGGSRGVGRGIAMRLAADGARVAVNYRQDADAAEEVVVEIKAAGGTARAYQAAVDDTVAVEDMLAAIDRELGPVDLVVSNAGTASRENTIADTDPDEYLRLLAVHALGPLALIRAALPGLRNAGRADVIVVSSVIARDDVAGAVSFLASRDGEYLTGQRIELDGGGPDSGLLS